MVKDVSNDARPYAEIGLRLRAARAVIGGRQHDFGRRAGIAQNIYSQYENGKTRPDIDSGVQLCDPTA